MRNKPVVSSVFQQNETESIENVIEKQLENRKIKKFLRIAVPILVLEVIAIVILAIYWLALPKNFCKISTNIDGAVVYVNNEEMKQFKFEQPEKKSTSYYYEVDISIKLPSSELYDVSYSVECKNCDVSVGTTAIKKDGKYNIKVAGGTKTTLISSINLTSEKVINSFDVKINIYATKSA